MLPTVEESRGYDFLDPENAEKWRGLFVNPLRKVLENVHPELTAEETALEYVESLCLRLLGTLCAQPMPLTVQDVEERINRAHGGAVGRCALAEAAEAAHGKKWKGILPQERLQTLLKEVLMYKIDTSVSIYMTAILEHVSGEVLKLAGNYIKKISQRGSYSLLSCRDIKTAMCADKVLMGLFSGDPEMSEGAPPAPAPAPAHARRGSLSYTELVRDLLTDEKHALRDLHLIIRVFKDELERILEKDPKTIALIFGNIVDIYELTVTLLGNLEDAIEMSQDSPTPYIGSCFEELAEVEEFRAYVRYANIVTRHDSRQALQQLVDDPGVSERLETAGRGFRLAVKYYLPRLLLAPVAHVFLYHSYVLAFLRVAPASDDRESFKQVECNLHPIKKILANALANGPKHDTQLPVATRTRRQLAIEKCQELARTVDNWDGRDVAQCCSEFVREDTLVKLGPGRRAAERRAFLFDGLLLLCKPVPGATTGNSTTALLGGGGGGAGGGGGGGGLLKLKEKLHVRKLELLEHADTDEARHCIEVSSGGTSLVLACASAADRRAWLADLVMLSTKPMLDRALDSILADLERRHPLQLPPASLYRFAIPDSPDNIVLEEHKGATPAPLIKGATLIKLVERLTYHIYADLNLVRTFLTTYRSFCSPAELLALLVERFRIPEPGQVYDPPHPESIESIASDAEKLSKNSTREDWKRYRKEFEQPVKFRVINVLRHWVDQHFYDFERDPPLLQQLKEFLESVDGKPMKKWVQSVLKTLQRKSAAAAAADAELGVCHVFDRPAPPLLRHLHDPDRCDWHPLALHPVELARQLTVLEFQLYRQVKPSELVGAVWTKKDKEKTSPNLLRIIKHTTNFTRWMEKWIVCSENLEERVGVVCRLLALASALHALHNFNAVLACVCAAGSASVHRLARTWQLVPPRLLRVLQALRELNSDHFRRYQERLRSINPPCVPFLGMYLTNILHIEEGNLDYLPNSELINFSKRRKVAEITGEIQQYQNQPYCLTVEPKTRAFLESLDPFPGMDDNEITNYLYAQSLHIEPRTPAKPLPKFPRRYPELSLKLVKLSRRAADQQPPDDNISVSQLSPTGSSMWGDGASVCSLPIHQDDRGPRSEERGSLISPRLERSSSHTFSQLSLLDKGLALFDKTARSSTSRSSSGRDEPPSPRGRHSPRRSRPPSAERRPPALSPRAPIVDADLFYCQDHRSEERVPPLLPRNSITMQGADEPPRVPRRPNDDIPPSLPPAPGSEPPASPPERPPPSPKHQDLVSSTLSRMPTLSPKRSPAPQPPSPHVAADRALAFSFPARGAPAPSPPAPPLTPHPVSSASSACGTPPPLPPRRRRDSAAPPTPAPGPAPAPAAAPAPPPLPPRPPPPPELLRPAHSTILQRRHHTSTTAPQLPPKPPPPAVAPRT